MSLGLLISSVVKLRLESLLLDSTRLSEAALDIFFTLFLLAPEPPLVIFISLDPRRWGCLREELLPVEPN